MNEMTYHHAGVVRAEDYETAVTIPGAVYPMRDMLAREREQRESAAEAALLRGEDGMLAMRGAVLRWERGEIASRTLVAAAVAAVRVAMAQDLPSSAWDRSALEDRVSVAARFGAGAATAGEVGATAEETGRLLTRRSPSNHALWSATGALARLCVSLQGFDGSRSAMLGVARVVHRAADDARRSAYLSPVDSTTQREAHIAKAVRCALGNA